MSYSNIQAKINRGYGIAAEHLGLPAVTYRPNGPTDPIQPANIIEPALYAQFASKPSYTFLAPTPWVSKSEWFGLFDPTNVLVGDYIVSGFTPATFFVASIEPLAPIMVIYCNSILNVGRTIGEIPAGENPPGGDQGYNEARLLTGWPAAVMEGGGKQQRSDLNLPGDVNIGGWTVWLPLTPGVNIRGDDILTDQVGLRHLVVASELTQRGWRIVTIEAQN